MRQSLLAARASEVRHLGEAAWGMVASYHDRVARGLMTEDAAKSAAKESIRRMRYDKTNYFFVWDLNGTSVAHGGNPQQEGRNFFAGPDAARSPGISDMVRRLVGMVRDHGEGFTTYRMPKAGQTIPLDKISYTKLFEPWGWAIGTGAYVADIDTFFWSRATSDLTVAAALTALAAIFSFVLGRDLSRSLRGLTGVVNALAGGDLSVAIPSTDRGDEVGVMARAMRIFRDNAIRAAGNDAEFQKASMRLEAALSNMSQGLGVFDRNERLEICNDQFASILGLAPEDIRPGMSIRDVIQTSHAVGNYPGREVDDLVAERQAITSRRESGTIVIELANHRLVSIKHRPMPNGGWVATYEDVTDRRAADAKITHMARHDALTGLPNRQVLSERIAQALTETGRQGQSALLCLDLDDFKRVNDTLGHSAGDTLLIAVSERLLACVREGDTVARLGGDEFAIVQVGIARPEDAKLLAERVIATIQQPFLLDGHPVCRGCQHRACVDAA